MSNHTPGSWKFLEEGHTEEEHNRCRPLTIGQVDPPYDDIASVYSADDATVWITREQAIANARLFAAAKDLLAVAIEFDRFSLVIESAVCGTASPWPPNRKAIFALIETNRAAIAKATACE
jgi:hypothetical protein